MNSAAAAGIFFSVIGTHEITIGTNSLQSLSLWERVDLPQHRYNSIARKGNFLCRHDAPNMLPLHCS